MRVFAGLVFSILFLNLVNAETFYCWSLSGLNMREQATVNGKIIDKIPYGQKVEIPSMDQDFNSYHEDSFLPGINEDGSSDVKITGYWFKVDYNGKSGYVFSGYLSRFPAFIMQKTTDNGLCESSEEYLNRNFKVLNVIAKAEDSTSYGIHYKTKMYEPGIMIIDNSEEKGIAMTFVFANMTMNEALLFVKFNFQLFEVKNPDDRSKLESGMHFYGQSVSYDKYEINFPAPDGKITILQLGITILITYYGSC
ncbi:MAG: SH3 domain-containing protein [Saprospiraceae bacterium]|nr:SH3 domain-containing protein [Saprospiraceae bacterium]